MFGGNAQVIVAVKPFKSVVSQTPILNEGYFLTNLKSNITWLKSFELYDRFDVRKGPKLLLMDQITTRNCLDLALITKKSHHRQQS
jgi:hypothetical protein